MVVEHSQWLSTWFENCAYIKIPIEAFDLRIVSFTYGDSHPTFSPRPRADNWKEYRRQLYTYEEIGKVIEKYGLRRTGTTMEGSALKGMWRRIYGSMR